MSNGGGTTDEPEAFDDSDRVRRALEESIDREALADAEERAKSPESPDLEGEERVRRALEKSIDRDALADEPESPPEQSETSTDEGHLDLSEFDVMNGWTKEEHQETFGTLRFRRLPIAIGTGLVVGFIIFGVVFLAGDNDDSVATTESRDTEQPRVTVMTPTTFEVGRVIQDDLGDFLDNCSADSPPVQGEPAWDIVEVLDEDDKIEITFGGDAEAYIEGEPFNSGLSLILRTAEGEFIDEITWLFFQGEVEFGPSIGRLPVRWEWADDDTIRFRFPEGLPEGVEIEVQSRVILEGGGFLCDGTGG